MEKYKKKLQSDIFWGSIYCSITIIFIISIIIIGFGESTTLISGFLAGGMGSILYKIRKKKCLLKDEEALKKSYIQNTDERMDLIAAYAARTGIRLVLTGLYIAMVISAYFSKVVFITLIACSVSIIIILFITTTIYNKVF